MFDMTETDRYTVFGPYRKRSFDICLSGMQEGRWQVQEYILNRQYGSAFDKWVEMGAQPLQSQEECALLSSLAQPMMHTSVLAVQDGSLHLKAELEPLEVRFLHIGKET